MPGLTLRLALSALAILAFAAGHLPAGELYNKQPAKGDTVAMPKPADVKALSVQPTAFTLKGVDDSRQLVVTAALADRAQDLSGDVQYEAADAKIIRITSTGRVVPVANGSTTVTIKYGDKSSQVNVKVESCDVNLPINFTNHIVPIFTKLGCNSGGCHGKSGGQNNFALSLLGFVPELDYVSLVKEGRGGRRLLPSAPEASLLLAKAAGQIAHAGGKRMELDSDEYKLIRRWIASGMPFGNPTDPFVAKISVSPDHRILTRQNRQQFSVIAHYSDGSTQDVTQRAQFESNDTEIAVVDGAGLVRTLDLSGEAAVMARYQAQVAVFRATVPLGMKTPDYKFEPKNVVDVATAKKWKELGIVPSELSSDEQFIRRLSLHLTGSLPTPDQVKSFLTSNDPQKREKLVDALVETPEYSYLFANKWADILRVKRRGDPSRAENTFAFHGWIRQAIAQDMPYDQFVRSILAASGPENLTPPVAWYRELNKPEEFVDDTAQVFLGLRVACAQCHHHPYEKWSQDDYYGLAAFFGRVGRKQQIQPGASQNQVRNVQTIFPAKTGTVTNKRTGQPAQIKALDGPLVVVSADDDPRHKLVDWMTDTKNPYFARAVANRYWAHFFGRGIVDPLDDMRITNPPSNPELLEALAKELIDSKFSLKHLVKVIVKSRTYQLSAIPNEFNKHDKQAYARFYPQRLSAEVLYDSVNQVTAAPMNIGGLPQDKHGLRRAIMLPDEAFASYFLDVFGRPQRISACECERVSEANLAQALHLLNSEEVQTKLTRAGGRAEQLAKDARPDAEKVEELFLWAFARRPTAENMDIALEHISRHAMNKKVAYENILWALINTKEFVFNQ